VRQGVRIVTDQDEPRVNRKIADLLPRRSGELVFEADWDKRAFGMALILMEKGLFSFDDFRWRQVSSIAVWDRTHGPDEPYRYWEHWLRALERSVIEKGVLSKEEIDKRAAQYMGFG